MRALPAIEVEGEANGNSTLRNQRESPLLRLPPELRNEIYTDVLGGRKVDICYQYMCHSCRYIRPRRRRIVPHYPRTLLSILEVCRHVQGEARLLPFSTTTFSVIHRWDWFKIAARLFEYDKRWEAMRKVGFQLETLGLAEYLDFELSSIATGEYDYTFKSLASQPNLETVCVPRGAATIEDQAGACR